VCRLYFPLHDEQSTLYYCIEIQSKSVACTKIKMNMMIYFFLILVIYCCFCFQYSVALPPGFREEGIVKISGVSTIGFVPLKDDDFIFLAAVKNGEIVAILNPGSESSDNVKTETVLDLSDRICTNGELGLHQVRAHPQIEDNGYIYVSYTYNKHGDCLVDTLEDGPVTRLSRFILDLDELKIDADSEEVLLETDPLRTKTHNGGDIVFGKDDGYLYLSIGDSGMKHPQTPSQELNHLFGKIIRITDDGKIPPDNPWKNDDDNEDEKNRRCNFGGHNNDTDVICEEIFAFGFRNPFRMNQHPDSSTTRIYVSDVGGTTWEEINEIESGGNYGFPIREGPCEKKSYDECKIPSDRSLKDPTFWYPHDSEGAACVAGSAVVPKGIGWPKKYENAMMYLDFVFDKLYFLEEDIDGACRECDIPIPEYFNSTFFDLQKKDLGKPVQLLFGPYKDTQALYYTTRYGSPNIRRIWYDGGNNDEDNENSDDENSDDDTDEDAKPHRQPIAAVTADKLLAPIGTDIQFDGSESLDPDGGDLTYYWSFGDENDDGDDESSSTRSNPSHAYNEQGLYTVSLIVTDPGGISDTVQILVSIGTPPPEPIIESPEAGATFAVGDVFILIGRTGDDDDDDHLLEWEVKKHHKDHFHPFLDYTTGNNVRIDPGPSPEDFLASTNSYLEVLLTVTDSKTGLSTTTSRNIMPKTVQMVFDSEPESGMELVLDGYSVTTPAVVTSWANHQLHVEVPADQKDGFKFFVWSDNDGLGIESGTERTIVVRETEDKFTALFMAQLNLETQLNLENDEIGNIAEDDDDDDEDKNDEIENNEVVDHDEKTDEKMEHENVAIETENDEIEIDIGKEEIYSRERNDFDEVGSNPEESVTIMYNQSSARIGMTHSISTGIIIFTSVVILALVLLE
jgi:glucose/arabinose dehydrogenase/PKD repeat protein